MSKSIFSHASENQIKNCLFEATKVMNPTSIFVMNFMIGDSNYEKDEWFYDGCCTYTFDHMQSLIHESGLFCRQQKYQCEQGSHFLIKPILGLQFLVNTL